jgi:exonuclease SbcC
MIPLKLKLTGFLSYHNTVEVDFSTFDLACISGNNGAGKSSLLDAITWVLFGQARKKDETLINSTSESAEVVFRFEYEHNIYRIQRVLTRGKSTLLELQIQDGERLRVLTEATMRATQARIETVLRMDYDTFVNASFFLQGKADQFTQQRPGDRKRILASILGLEIWETYREKTADQRKSIESDLSSLDGRLMEINAELAEEPTRLARLKDLEQDLSRQVETRKTQELVMTTIKQARESLKRQKEIVDNLELQLTRGTTSLNALLARQSSRNHERGQHLEIIQQAERIEAAHQAWLENREMLAKMEDLASTFRDQEKERQEPLKRISAEQARLEQERDNLLRLEKDTGERANQIGRMEAELTRENSSLELLETRLKHRLQLEQSQAIVSRFREQANLRLAPLTEISNEKARLEQEMKSLEKQAELIETQRSALLRLQTEQAESEEQLRQVEILLEKNKQLDDQIQSRRNTLLVLRSNNDRLKLEMEALDERIKKLEVSSGAICPLCGQPLSAQERVNLIESLRTEGKQKGDDFRKNKSTLETLTREITLLEKETSNTGRAEKDQLLHVSNLTKIKERLQANLQAIAEWEEGYSHRLVEVKDKLKTGDYCTLAKQNLARIDRELLAIGKALGISSPQSASIFETVEEKVREIENKLLELKGLDEERIKHTSIISQFVTQLDTLRRMQNDWLQTGKPRLENLELILEQNAFAAAERELLATIDARLLTLGYDTALHENTRQIELAGRKYENELRTLEAARAALAPIERELDDLKLQVNSTQSETDQLRDSCINEKRSLEELQANIPDLQAAERAALDAQERENILTREVGAAHQKVNVLKDLRLRKIGLENQREDLAGQIKNHKILERAFGKDGVPALLIEQALPQIEEKANELLERLSDGAMSVRFITQAGYKDKKRDDLRETLDIQISDGAGTRDYEMFSGGEAFRVNFAIRLALSEILARRTGARLQTLVIDEGFGSQDALGRQRLVEAINLVRVDFAKILIITHLEELKEAFSHRVEVEKTPSGSTIKVI